MKKSLGTAVIVVFLLLGFIFFAGKIGEKSKTELRHWCGNAVKGKLTDSAQAKYYLFFEPRMSWNPQKIEVDLEEFDRYKKGDTIRCF